MREQDKTGQQLKGKPEELHKKISDLQEIDAMRKLIGGVAHDFNNILSTIMGYTSLLQMKMDRVDPVASYVKQILTATEKAADLTQSLFMFSRKQSANLKPHDLNDAIKRATKLLSRLITEDIEIKIEPQKEKIVVMADTGHVDQILMNLIVNARDAMPKGGTITIGIKRTSLDSQFKSIDGFGAKGEYAVISVSDTGPGMDIDTMELLFKSSFSPDDADYGIGLGLAVVYGAAKQQNGFVDVISEKGKGTAVMVYLPLAEGAEIVEDQDVVDIQRGTETILIADDNSELRVLARAVLEGSGYTVIEAVDGAAAITEFTEHEPDLLILDVVMPKKNGREVFEEAKKIRPHVKTLFISGYTSDIVYQKGIGENDYQFLPKPFSPYDLLKRIRDILDGKTD